jgi:hypothetical protein
MIKNLTFYTFFVFFLLGTILVSPWGTDEGWLLYIANNYLETSRFTNEVYHLNYDIAFTKTLLAFLAVIGNLTDFSYFFARLPFFMISIANIFLLHRVLLLLKIEKLYTLVILLSMTIWLGYSTMVRAETIYIFSILFSVFSVLYYVKYKTSLILFFAILINALSFSTHPNGIFGYIVLFIGFIIFFKQVTKKDYVYIVSGIILGAIVLFYSLLWYQSIDEFLISFNEMKNDNQHTVPFYYEYSRYINLFLAYKLFIPVFILSLIGLSIKLVSWKESNKLERFLMISAIVSLLYLLFLPAKFISYFSVPVPILLIFIAYLLQYLSNNFSKFLIVFFSCLLILFFLKNFTRNDSFLENFNIASQRIVILKKLKEETKNAKVLTLPMMFPYLKGDGRKLYYSYKYIDQVDYVIPLEGTDISYLKDKGFEYKYSFKFQNYFVNSLFIRKKVEVISK